MYWKMTCILEQEPAEILVELSFLMKNHCFIPPIYNMLLIKGDDLIVLLIFGSLLFPFASNID